MAQVEVRLDLPADVVALLGDTDEAAALKAREAVVLELLRAGRLSQGKAAQVLGVTRHDVIDLMAAHDIPSGPATIQEYRQEIEQADRLLPARRAAPQ